LPKNRACLLIVPPRLPEGDLRAGRRPGEVPSESSNRFKKKKHKTAGQKQWRQTAHKTYKTPS
jgi:hypothetical protein